MDNILQINAIKRQMGQILMRAGTMYEREAIGDFTDTTGDFTQFSKPFTSLGLPVGQLDETYYFTSWDNWQKIITTINPILSQFNWIAERFDCDKRSFLQTALIALFFEINTCRPVYCSVYRVGDGAFAYTHYANVFVDTDGNAWLWDADENGLTTKITSTTPVINNKKYVIKAIK